MPGHIAIAPGVLVLLFLRLPLAVTGLIVAVVVDTANAVIRWRVPHVLKEGMDAVPSLADGDAPAAVVAVVIVTGVIAALLHGNPAVVNRQPCETVILSQNLCPVAPF